MSVALGIDWAHDHWLSLEYCSHDTALRPETYESLEDLWEDYDHGAEIHRLCIDIPIGLPTGPNERAVDKECRAHLDRKSTVFRVPIREALEADTSEEANQESRSNTRTDETDGVGVQPPAYAIREQILEVNEFIEECEQDTTNVIYEVHPELCFTALSGSPTQYSKKTAHGVAERIEALDKIVDDASGLLARHSSRSKIIPTATPKSVLTTFSMRSLLCIPQLHRMTNSIYLPVTTMTTVTTMTATLAHHNEWPIGHPQNSSEFTRRV